jgi:branched-chain amino acid transport system substrate-binding protein
MKKLLLGLLVLTLVFGLLLGGCTSTASSTQPSAPAKVLKIGLMASFSDSTAIDWMKGVELAADLDNKAGGLQIGGDKYNVQIIKYDGQNNQATEEAAVNRLVYEDKVSFVITGSAFDAFIPTTEKNKVIAFVSALNPADLSPQNKYVFNANLQTAAWASVIGSYCKSFPDKVKTVVRAYQDNQGGHFVSGMTANMWKSNGVTTIDEFYPSEQVDLSSVATKIISLNPTLVTTQTGSDVGDALVFNALYQAGFKGQLFSTSSGTAETLKQILSAGALEGFVCQAWPYEFDPALNQAGVDFKKAWIDKYGKWESPNVVTMNDYYCLRAALLQSGSTDTDKVADVISKGLTFESPCGSARMMSRPDLGQDRTVDSVANYYIKQIRGGKVELLASITIDEATAYYQKANPPGNGPPAGPPGGGPPPGP